MKITFSKKTNISRKGVLWIYFSIIIVLLGILLALSYYLITNEPEEVKVETKSLKINEDKLNSIGDFDYLGVPIDLNSGLGKTEPFE